MGSIPRYGYHEACSVEQVAVVLGVLSHSFDGPPRSSAPGELSGQLAGLPATIRYTQRPTIRRRIGYTTMVEVRVATAPLALHLYTGASMGPKIRTGVAAFDSDYCLHGCPSELVLRVLEQPVIERLVSHHVRDLFVRRDGIELEVTGWISDAPVALSLMRLATDVAARIPAAVTQLGSQPGAHQRWQQELAAWQRARTSAGRVTAVIAILVLLALGGFVGMIVYLGS